MKRDMLTRIPMEGVLNFRSLGGYVAGKEKNHATKYNVLYRSARLFEATENDKELITSLGIKTVLDLRDNEEILAHPDYAASDPAYTYRQISVMPELSPAMLESFYNVEDIRTAMLALYIQLVDHSGDRLREALDAVADGISAGGVLFHCTIGRDRTGVLAALLLGMCDVRPHDIVANYQVSETYLESRFGPDTPLYTPNSNMSKLLAHIDKKYRGLHNYLGEIGLQKEKIEQIRHHFLADLEG